MSRITLLAIASSRIPSSTPDYSLMSAVRIQIISHNGIGYTSLKRAKDYVRRHRADWINERSIRFHAEHYRDQAAMLPSAASAYDAGAGYDHNVSTDSCTRRELRGLPMVGNVNLLLCRTSQPLR